MGGIDGEVLTPDKTVSDALGDDLVEYFLNQIALGKAVMAVMREGGVIGDFIFKGEAPPNQRYQKWVWVV